MDYWKNHQSPMSDSLVLKILHLNLKQTVIEFWLLFHVDRKKKFRSSIEKVYVEKYVFTTHSLF